MFLNPDMVSNIPGSNPTTYTFNSSCLQKNKKLNTTKQIPGFYPNGRLNFKGLLEYRLMSLISHDNSRVLLVEGTSISEQHNLNSHRAPLF